MKPWIKDIMPYITIVILLFVFFFQKSNKNDTNQTNIVIDSIMRVIQLKEQRVQSIRTNPQPIINIYPSNPATNSDLTNSLISQFKQLKDDNKKLEAYMKVIATKVYRNVYEDSLAIAVVTDTVANGVLKSQKFDLTLKPRKVSFYEKTITKKLKPKFTLSAGIGVQSQLNYNAQPQLQGIIGIKNKKGNELQLGYSTDKSLQIIFKKDIFVKY